MTKSIQIQRQLQLSLLLLVRLRQHDLHLRQLLINPTQTITSVCKPNLSIAVIDVQDDEEVVIVVEDNEVEDEIGNLFRETSSQDDLQNE